MTVYSICRENYKFPELNWLSKIVCPSDTSFSITFLGSIDRPAISHKFSQFSFVRFFFIRRSLLAVKSEKKVLACGFHVLIARFMLHRLLSLSNQCTWYCTCDASHHLCLAVNVLVRSEWLSTSSTCILVAFRWRRPNSAARAFWLSP